MKTISLDGAWQFRLANDPAAATTLTRWMPAVVPGTVHHHLQLLGKIPDPHDGRNELDLQWIDQKDWEWTRELEVPAEATKSARQELVCGGLETVAKMFL